MFEEIRSFIMEYVDVPEESITLNTAFMEELAMNSLDIMTMIGDVEDKYDIEIPTEDLSNIYTVGELVEYLNKKVGK